MCIMLFQGPVYTMHKSISHGQNDKYVTLDRRVREIMVYFNLVFIYVSFASISCVDSGNKLIVTHLL